MYIITFTNYLSVLYLLQWDLKVENCCSIIILYYSSFLYIHAASTSAYIISKQRVHKQRLLSHLLSMYR